MPATPTPSLEAIAKAANVSISTASLALNDHARVSDRTKIRVREAAAKLDYIPNQAARRLATLHARRTALEQVGFIIFERHGQGRAVTDAYMAMMRGVENELAAHDSAMLFLRVGSESEYDKVTRLMRAGRVDAWLVTGTVDQAAIDLIAGTRKPFVVLGTHTARETPVHTVDVNFHEVGRLAATRIAALGHRRIGFIGSSMRMAYQRSVLDGFNEGLAPMGIARDESLVSTNAGHPPDRPLDARLNALLTASPRPTAIFTGEPGHLTPIADLLRTSGVRVPDDISLAGAIITASGATGPSPLARIEYPLIDVGRAGASLLREVFGQGEPAPRQVRVSPAFFAGPSCAPPAGARPQ